MEGKEGRTNHQANYRKKNSINNLMEKTFQESSSMHYVNILYIKKEPKLLQDFVCQKKKRKKRNEDFEAI